VNNDVSCSSLPRKGKIIRSEHVFVKSKTKIHRSFPMLTFAIVVDAEKNATPPGNCCGYSDVSWQTGSSKEIF
jgi:hypothetical protein